MSVAVSPDGRSLAINAGRHLVPANGGAARRDRRVRGRLPAPVVA
jgi:hypothetical protein